MATQNATANRSTVTVRDITSIFFYEKKILLCVFFGFVIGAILLIILSPSIYEAKARVLVKPRIDKPMIFEADLSRLNVDNRVDQQNMNSAVYLFTSPEVLRPVVEKFNLADSDEESDILQAIAKLEGQMTVEPLSLSNVLEVTFRSKDEENIVAHLNAILDSYVAYHIKINQTYEGRLEFFEQQTRLYRNKYASHGSKLAEAKRELQLVNPEIQTETVLQVVRDLRLLSADLAAQREASVDQLNHLQAAKAELQEGHFMGMPGNLIQAYPALVEFERSLTQLIINKRRAENDYMPGTKRVTDAADQLNNMYSKIREYTRQIEDSLNLQIRAVAGKQKKVEEKIEELLGYNGDIAAEGILLKRLELEHQLAEENYKLYQGKLEEARINYEKNRANFANVVVSARPSQPLSPWFPRPGLIMLVAIVVGLVLAIASALLAYGMEQRVRNTSDITTRTRLKVLGTLDAL